MTAIKLDEAFKDAVTHYRAGQFLEAETACQELLKTNSNHVGALHLLGVITMGRKEYTLAADLIKKAISLNPGNAQAHYNLGFILSKQGELNQAIACYRQAVAINPGFAEAYGNIGLVLDKQGELDQAIVCFRQAIAINPDFADVHSNLGLVLTKQGAFDEAIVCYRQAISLNPGLAATYSNLGAVLDKQGELDQAIACYHQAISLSPGLVDAHSNLGLVLAKRGELDQAIACFRQAISLNPSLVDAHSNLGLAFALRGELDQAIACFRQAILLNPNVADVHSNLGLVLARQGELEQAIVSYRQAILLNPGLAVAHGNLGNTLRNQNDYAEAVKSFECAIALTSESSVSIRGLAKEVLKVRGDAIEGLLQALYSQGKNETAIGQFRGFVSEFCDEEDSVFDNLYIEGLNATLTNPSPIRRRDRFRFLLKQFERALALSGMVAECGCFRGLSSYLLCSRLKQHDVAFNGARYQIFDSFAGLSVPSEIDTVIAEATETIQRSHSKNMVAGNYAESLDNVKQSLSQFPGIEYYPGWIPAAFPKSKKNRYRFVHVDVDLYQPTKDSFEYFWPRMVPGGVIVCDDYNWPGAEQAVKEFCQSVGVDYEVSPYGQAYFYKPDV